MKLPEPCVLFGFAVETANFVLAYLFGQRTIIQMRLDRLCGYWAAGVFLSAIYACAAPSPLSESELSRQTIHYSLQAALSDPKTALRLHIRGKDYREIPPPLLQLRSLQDLQIVQSELSSLPANFTTLAHLKVLVLSSNRFREFPGLPGQLQHLERLELGFNSIDTFPNELRGFSALRQLDLRNNPLGQAPVAIANFSELRELNLRATQITTVPEEYSRLQKLELLDLSENKLKSLPEAIPSLRALRQLRIDGNKLTELSAAVGRLENLEELHAFNNPLTSIHPSIFQLKKLKRFPYTGSFTRARATLTILPIRSEPALTAPLVTTLKRGDVVNVLYKTGRRESLQGTLAEWWFVKPPPEDSAPGYVPDHFLDVSK